MGRTWCCGPAARSADVAIPLFDLHLLGVERAVQLLRNGVAPRVGAPALGLAPLADQPKRPVLCLAEDFHLVKVRSLTPAIAAAERGGDLEEALDEELEGWCRSTHDSAVQLNVGPYPQVERLPGHVVRVEVEPLS